MIFEEKRSAFPYKGNLASQVGDRNSYLAAPLISVVLILTISPLRVSYSEIFDIVSVGPIILMYAIWLVSSGIILWRVGFSSRAVNHEKINTSRLLSLFILLSAMAICVVVIREIRSDSVDMLRQFGMTAYCFGIFYVLHMLSKRRDFSRPVILSSHIILAICVVSIGGDFFGLLNFENFNGRYFGFLGDGVAWLLTLPLVVYFACNKPVLCGLAAIALVPTLSRGAIIVGLASILLIFLTSKGPSKFRYGLGISIIAITAVYYNDFLIPLLDRFTDIRIYDDARTITTRNGLEIFSLHPIFGAGFNSLAYYYPRYDGMDFDGGFSTAASTFVQILSDSGIVGFVGFFAFLVGLSFDAFQALRRRESSLESNVAVGLAAWLLAMIWLNQSASWLLATSYLTPLVFGLAGLISGYTARSFINPTDLSGFTKSASMIG